MATRPFFSRAASTIPSLPPVTVRPCPHPLTTRATSSLRLASLNPAAPLASPSLLPHVPHNPFYFSVPPLKITVNTKNVPCAFVSSSSSPVRSPKMGSLSAAPDSLPPLRYPPARRDDSVVDVYHGVRVPDPYRWLEDPEGEETKEFVRTQCALTDEVLRACGERERLRSEITKLFDHPRYEKPFKRDGNYFFFHNTGLQPQSVLYVQKELDGEAEVLLDPNSLSEDGTVALTALSVTEDAKYLAYGISSSGSDWVTIKVLRIEDKKLEPDTISWV